MNLESLTFPRSTPPIRTAEETSARAEQPGAFAKVLNQLGDELDRGEALVASSLSGGRKKLDASDLIALQAGIYRYSEVVDLSAKLVDRASSAVRTVIESGNR